MASAPLVTGKVGLDEFRLAPERFVRFRNVAEVDVFVRGYPVPAPDGPELQERIDRRGRLEYRPAQFGIWSGSQSAICGKTMSRTRTTKAQPI